MAITLFFFKILFIYLFGCFSSQLQHAGSSLHHEGSSVVTHRLRSCSTQPSNCGTLVPEHATSVVSARGLSFFAACGTLVPQPETEPMSPALQGRFLTTELPEQSCIVLTVIFLHSPTPASITGDSARRISPATPEGYRGFAAPSLQDVLP